MVLTCDVQQFMSMHRHQVFICCYYMFSLFQCCLNISTGRFDTAHHFYYHINAVIINNIFKIVCQFFCRDNFCIFCFITNQNFYDFQFRPYFERHFVFLFFNNMINTTANCTHTQQCDFSYQFCHDSCSSVSLCFCIANKCIFCVIY